MKPRLEGHSKTFAGYFEVVIAYGKDSYIYKITNERDLYKIKLYANKGWTNRLISLVKQFPYRKEIKDGKSLG